MKRLDKSLPYGEICGGSGRARYNQDGVDFDCEGLPLDNIAIVPFLVDEPDISGTIPDIQAIKQDRNTLILKLHNDGKTAAEISLELGISKPSVYAVLKRLK